MLNDRSITLKEHAIYVLMPTRKRVEVSGPVNVFSGSRINTLGRLNAIVSKLKHGHGILGGSTRSNTS